MKRTEIIIETQRVTIIQRRSHSNQDSYDRSSINRPIVDVVDGDNGESANDEVGNFKIPGEQNEPCTDLRNR